MYLLVSIVATLSAAYWQVRVMTRIASARSQSAKARYSSGGKLKVAFGVSYGIGAAAIIGAGLGLRSVALATTPLTRPIVVVACLWTSIMLMGFLLIWFTMLLSVLRGIFNELFQGIGNAVEGQNTSLSGISRTNRKEQTASRGKN